MGLSVAEVLQVTAMSVSLKRFSLHISLSFACRGDHLSRSGTLKGRRNRCHYRLGVYTDNMCVDTGSYLCVRACVLGEGGGVVGAGRSVWFILSLQFVCRSASQLFLHGRATQLLRAKVQLDNLQCMHRSEYLILHAIMEDKQSI